MLLRDDMGMLIKIKGTNIFNIEKGLIILGGGFYVNNLLNYELSFY